MLAFLFLYFCECREKVEKKRSTVVMVDGSQVEELDALRDNDQLFIF